MVEFNDLTRFCGSKDEDALRWLEAFVIATSAFSDEAVLRMFPIFLGPDSPAEEWYYGLKDNSIVTWNAVQRNFRHRWISRAGGQAKKESEETAVEKFRNHRLTDDAIFGSAPVDIAAMNKVVVDWVDDHAQLGTAAKLDDETLIQATVPYLPAFLRAFLRSELNPPTTFQMLCTRIREVTDQALESESLRRLDASLDWQAKIEKRLDDLSEMVKKLQMDISIPPLPKAVESDQANPEIDAATTGVGEDETNSFLLPQHWKNTSSTNKAGMVESVKELMGNICNYKPSNIGSNVASMINICLLHYHDIALSPPHQADHHNTSLLKSIFQIHCQRAFSGLGDVTSATQTWNSLSNTSNNWIERDCIFKSHHVNRISYSNRSDRIALSADCKRYNGGFVQFGGSSGYPQVMLDSFSTTLYFLLSTSLAEHFTTGNNGYIQAAIDSANWITKWALDQESHLVKSFSWNLTLETLTGPSSLSVVLTSLFIEGLCVLSTVTGDQKWSGLATDLCDAAMTHRDWHNDEGIFKSGSTFRGLLTHGLSVAYQRNPTKERLRHTIRSYINMQLNAPRDGPHAQTGDLNAGVQNGPNHIPYTQGDIATLDTLMAAVAVNH